MSQNCNKIVLLNDAQFDTKAALAKAATAALLQAVGDSYKAAEVVHSGQAIERAAVYLRSATTRLNVADAALVRNKEILETVPVLPDAVEWLRELDYARLYVNGIRDRAIPANEMQWSALVEINRSEGYLATWVSRTGSGIDSPSLGT